MFVERDINESNKKGSTGLGFENFLDRITSLINFNTLKKKKPSRFQENVQAQRTRGLDAKKDGGEKSIFSD